MPFIKLKTKALTKRPHFIAPPLERTCLEKWWPPSVCHLGFEDMGQAHFPRISFARLRGNAYIILESRAHSLFVDDVAFRDSSPVGTLFASNSNGTYFVWGLRTQTVMILVWLVLRGSMELKTLLTSFWKRRKWRHIQVLYHILWQPELVSHPPTEDVDGSQNLMLILVYVGDSLYCAKQRPSAAS